MSFDNEKSNTFSQSSPIRLVFEGSTKPDRIAEFVELLSELYGEDLHVILANTIPPTSDEIGMVA